MPVMCHKCFGGAHNKTRSTSADSIQEFLESLPTQQGHVARNGRGDVDISRAVDQIVIKGHLHNAHYRTIGSPTLASSKPTAKAYRYKDAI